MRLKIQDTHCADGSIDFSFLPDGVGIRAIGGGKAVVFLEEREKLEELHKYIGLWLSGEVWRFEDKELS
jgi:hypothetical protein